MRARELGIGLQSDKRPGTYAALARLAEAHGIDVISVYADLMFQPPLPALLEIAAATDTVRLGPVCLNPFSLHPFEIAGQAAALDLAVGRAGVPRTRPRHVARRRRHRAATTGAAPWRRRPASSPRLLRHDPDGYAGDDVPARRRDDAALRDASAGDAAADRHLGATDGRTGRTHRRRGQGRRLGEPGDGRRDASVHRRRRRRGRP